jgi:hypothetical protein
MVRNLSETAKGGIHKNYSAIDFIISRRVEKCPAGHTKKRMCQF